MCAESFLLNFFAGSANVGLDSLKIGTKKDSEKKNKKSEHRNHCITLN